MSYSANVLPLGPKAASGAGTAIALGGTPLHAAALHIYGTFVATISIEVSPDDGTTWLMARDIEGNDLSGFTAATHRVIAGEATQVRLNLTAYTSGIVNADVLPRGS